MDIDARVAGLDWPGMEAGLRGRGCATTGVLLTPDECRTMSARYGEDALYRSRVVMARHGFGRGEYRYFAAPLPAPVGALRTALYARLAGLANEWGPGCYPPDHAGYLAACHAAGQARPTALLLRYGPGDYNCLHQDLYGDLHFPIQVAFLLSAPGADFTGGAFVLTEQRPRMQSRVEVVGLRQGEGVAFAVHRRPVQGARGIYKVTMRHGVSRVLSGERFTLGVIFHDAR